MNRLFEKDLGFAKVALRSFETSIACLGFRVLIEEMHNINKIGRGSWRHNKRFSFPFAVPLVGSHPACFVFFPDVLANDAENTLQPWCPHAMSETYFAVWTMLLLCVVWAMYNMFPELVRMRA